MSEARPFIKWAGGKRQLLTAILEVFPGRVKTYYEPFLGGGAVFFAMSGRFDRAVINDWNEDLINCYQAVRDFPEKVMEGLSNLPFSREVFDRLRKASVQDLTGVDRAVRMIYLNKTGFNGLYRVNKFGVFNVPFGKFKTPPTLFDRENIMAASEALRKNVVLTRRDFADVCVDAKEGDLVYFDPPYVPLNPTSDFTSYTNKGFGLSEQERLAKLFREIADRGAHCVLSNSNTEIVRDLYEGFEIREVSARRNINSKGDRRGPVTELLVIS